eukprot:3229064-Ditylum_brightwellii.AAC.1
MAAEIAKTAGMQLQHEVENTFHGRVQEPYIGWYCEYYLNSAPHDRTAKKDAIIPNLLIHNYPTRDERHQDSNGISHSTAPAILEVKGIHFGKNQQVRYPMGME